MNLPNAIPYKLPNGKWGVKIWGIAEVDQTVNLWVLGRQGKNWFAKHTVTHVDKTAKVSIGGERIGKMRNYKNYLSTDWLLDETEAVDIYQDEGGFDQTWRSAMSAVEEARNEAAKELGRRERLLRRYVPDFSSLED